MRVEWMNAIIWLALGIMIGTLLCGCATTQSACDDPRFGGYDCGEVG